MDAASVIIVEDNAFISADLASKLKRIGCQILGIANRVDQAVEMITRFCPQLVFIGIKPRLPADGMMTAKVIQNHCEGLPIIFMSEALNHDALQRIKLSGPYGFIPTPFVEQELLVLVEKVLEKRNCANQERVAN
jgi:DNA-binding NtrC family response regulator